MRPRAVTVARLYAPPHDDARDVSARQRAPV